jgi:DNA-binding GntR family transcriptional regulator
VLGDALDSEFEVGEILPNERELAARFGVARATVRQALDQLEREGRLRRRRGVGTVVAPPRVGVDVSASTPGGPCDAWRPVDCARVRPPAAVARELGTEEGEEVAVVRRTLVADDRPVAAELLYVTVDHTTGLAPAADIASGPVRAQAVLDTLRHLPLDGRDRTVELGSAGAEDAKELDRLPGAPVLVVTTRYVGAGRTAAVSVATYRADTCRLTFPAPGGGEPADEAPHRRAS